MRPAKRIDPSPREVTPGGAFARLEAALAELPVGGRIAYLRKRVGLSQVALAQQVGRSVPWLSKVERGQLRCDNMSVIIELAAVFGVPLALLIDVDLRSVPARGDGCVDARPQRARPQKQLTVAGLAAQVQDALAEVTARLDSLQRSLEGLDANGDGEGVTVWVPVTIGDVPVSVPVRLSRREVLAAGGAALLGLADGVVDPDERARLAAAVDAPGRADAAVVARFQALLAHYRRLDDVIGGRRLLVPVGSSLDLIDHLGRTARPQVAQALLGVAAQYEQLIGWLHADSDDHDGAQRAYGRAVARATEAGSHALARFVLGWSSYSALNQRDAMAAVAHASAAQTGEGGLTPAVHAWAADLEARAWALARRPDEFSRKMDEATALLSLSAEHGRAGEPPWIYHFEGHTLAVDRAVGLTELGQSGAAVDAFDAAIAGLPADRARDQAYYLSWLARAHAGAGDAEQSGLVGCAAAKLAVQLGHTRSLATLRTLHTKLAATGTHAPAVADLADLLRSI